MSQYEQMTKAQLIHEIETLSGEAAEAEGQNATGKVEEELRKFLQHSADLIGILTHDGTFRKISPSWGKTLGYSEEEMLGRPFMDFLHPDDVEPTLRERTAQLEEGKTVFQFENRYRHKDGSYRWLDWTSHPDPESELTFAIARDVTEAKGQREELERYRTQLEGIVDERTRSLRESEERMAVTLRSIGDAVISTDKDGCVWFMNPTAETATGWGLKEAAGKPLDEVFDIRNEETGDRVENPVKRVFREGAVVGLANHTKLIRRDGTELPIGDSGAPIHDEAGSIIGAVLVFQDITERRLAEAELAEKAHDLGERVKELNCLYGLAKVIETPGMSLAEIFQEAPNLIPPSWQYPKDTCARLVIDGQEYRTEGFVETPWLQAGDVVVSGKKIGAIEVHYLEEKPEADEGPFLKEERQLLDALGERLGKVIQRKEAEEELRQYQHIVSSTNDLVALLDRNFTYLAANSAYLTAFEKTRDELLGKTVSEVFGEEVFEAVIAPKAGRCLAGEAVNYQTWMDIPEAGRRYMDATYSPYIGADKEIRGFVVISRDITERKFLEDELRNSRDRLRELAARLDEVREEERTALARELHDEVGQALTVMRMDLAMFEKEIPAGQGKLADRLHSMLDLTQDSVDRVNRMSHDLRSPVLEILGLEAAVESEALEYQERWGTEIVLRLEVGELEALPERDATVYRILKAALSNVGRHAEASRVEISLRVAEKELVLEVLDDGVGITDAQLRGQRTFGLLGMQERAERLGGTVEIERRPEGGTRIRAEVPVWPRSG